MLAPSPRGTGNIFTTTSEGSLDSPVTLATVRATAVAPRLPPSIVSRFSAGTLQSDHRAAVGLTPGTSEVCDSGTPSVRNQSLFACRDAQDVKTCSNPECNEPSDYAYRKISMPAIPFPMTFIRYETSPQERRLAETDQLAQIPPSFYYICRGTLDA